LKGYGFLAAYQKTMDKQTVDIRILHPTDTADFAALIRVFADAFEMPHGYKPPAESHLRGALETPHFLAMVATADGTIIGGLTAYILPQYYRERPQAYLYDIAVAAAFQRRGIGRKLLQAFNAQYAQKGFEEVFVQADVEDTHALDFYRATGACREAAVIHFTYELDECQV